MFEAGCQVLSPVINGSGESCQPCQWLQGRGNCLQETKEVNKMSFGDGWAVAERGRSCFISGCDLGPKSPGKVRPIKKKKENIITEWFE